jgi:hypothetical protein
VRGTELQPKVHGAERVPQGAKQECLLAVHIVGRVRRRTRRAAGGRELDGRAVVRTGSKAHRRSVSNDMPCSACTVSRETSARPSPLMRARSRRAGRQSFSSLCLSA